MLLSQYVSRWHVQEARGGTGVQCEPVDATCVRVGDSEHGSQLGEHPDTTCVRVVVWLGGLGGRRQLNCLVVPCCYFSSAVSLPLCYACTMLSGKVQASLKGLNGLLCTCI